MEFVHSKMCRKEECEAKDFSEDTAHPICDISWVINNSNTLHTVMYGVWYVSIQDALVGQRIHELLLAI